MKDLKAYIKESILDDIDDQIDDFSIVYKLEIIKWLEDNVKSIEKNKLEFDFNTTPITVNYDGNINFKRNITLLTNEMFQWGEVKGSFYCAFCDSLESLEGAPKKVGGCFYCSECNKLTSLKGAPKEVGGGFDCSFCNRLKSLEGAPNKVKFIFYCHHCDSLESLKYAPKTVIGEFNCGYCPSLTSLKGAPQKVEGNFVCNNCKTQFTEEDVEKVSKVKGEINC